jgi:CubicO group peptidase (beta-lactamase class C family)
MGGNNLMVDTTIEGIRNAAKASLSAAASPDISNPLFAGLFEAGSGGYYLWNVADWKSFTDKWTALAGENLRLVDFNTIEDAGTTWFIGTWVQGTDGYALLRSTDWNAIATYAQQHAGSLKLVDLDIHSLDGTLWYTGVWRQGNVKQQIVHELPWSDFTATWTQLSTKGGMRLIKLQSYQKAGATLYTGVFEAGTGGYALLGTSDWSQFYNYYTTNQGTMGLVDFQVDAHTGLYLGVWRQTAAAHQFVFGLDWDSFTAKWAELSGQGYRLRTVESYPSAPQWHNVYLSTLGTSAVGYAWKVARNGKVEGEGIHHNRAAQDPPSTNWSLDTRISLASVSKEVTAVATLHLLDATGHNVDQPFYPFIASKVGDVNAGVKTVTIRNLLTMQSGMVVDGSLNGDLWPFLSSYLQQPLVGTPGVTPAYSNTNFTILQGLINELSGQDYVSYVTQKILVPMGVDPAVFNANPDPSGTATLTYSGATDTRNGQYWGHFDFTAPGGWIASANELLKFLIGVRANIVLSAATTDKMFKESLGWYTYNGTYGTYYHHNGGLGNGATPSQGLNTGAIHFAEGYDAVLLINSPRGDIINVMIQAFETRALAVS